LGGTLWGSYAGAAGLLPVTETAVAADMRQVWVTAYTSTPEETDNTPFITASNKTVKDGFMAANFLPFGTKVKIPDLFDDKIFVVEDRMHPRKGNFVDIWMSSKSKALKFGIHFSDIVIVEMGKVPNPLLAKNSDNKNSAQD
jgi:3D (Asp-Asp-Asp) domain-containing protein